MLSVDELFSQGMVAKLELDPGKVAIILFKKSEVTLASISDLSKALSTMGLQGVFLATYGDPKDAMCGIEIKAG